MPNLTPNYNLKKPIKATENADIDVLNENMDKIDTQMKNNADNITTIDNKRKSGIKILKDIILNFSLWTFDGTYNLYRYIYSNSNIDQNSIVDVNIHLESLENAKSLTPVSQSSVGQIRLYSTEKPTNNIICDMIIQKEVV